MKILLFLLKNTNLINKSTGILISLYLLYYTRETVLTFDIIINNIKNNYFYLIFVLLIIVCIFILFYKNVIRNKYISVSLNIVVYSIFAIIELILKCFNKEPNHFGLTNNILLFNNNIEIKKILSIVEKENYLKEIIPLLKDLNISQQQNLINNINWDVITCKNDLYIYFMAQLTIEKNNIIATLNEPSLLDIFIKFLKDHPYGLIITLLISLGISWYFKDLILDYLKKSLELFNAFLIEHKKKLLADCKLAENNEIIGNQLEYIQKLLLKKEIDNETLLTFKFIMEKLEVMQKELITLSNNQLTNSEQIQNQFLDIERIIDYLKDPTTDILV